MRGRTGARSEDVYLIEGGVTGERRFVGGDVTVRVGLGKGCEYGSRSVEIGIKRDRNVRKKLGVQALWVIHEDIIRAGGGRERTRGFGAVEARSFYQATSCVKVESRSDPEC